MASAIETKPNDAQLYFSNKNAYGNVNPQQYKYSFSGADARVSVHFPQSPELVSYLDSVHTVSVSVHEAKSQVRSLGYRGAKGLTRSIRTIAGSMILTVVNDHPLRPLIDQYNAIRARSALEAEPDDLGPLLGWSVDMDDVGVGSYANVFAFYNRMASLLPPFNLVAQFVSETAPVTYDRSQVAPIRISRGTSVEQDQDGQRLLYPGAGLMLQGIEFIDEGFVVSVNDMVTEVTLSYIARDFKPISSSIFSEGGNSSITINEIHAKAEELRRRIFPPSPKPVEGNAKGLFDEMETE